MVNQPLQALILQTWSQLISPRSLPELELKLQNFGQENILKASDPCL